MSNWRFGAQIIEESGDFVVTIRDLPEVVTSGETHAEAISLAEDAVEVALFVRMEKCEPLPLPSPLQPGEIATVLPARLAAKAAIYAAWQTSDIRQTELARRMGRTDAEVRRILNPRHGTKIDQLEEAAKALGGRVNISFEAA